MRGCQSSSEKVACTLLEIRSREQGIGSKEQGIGSREQGKFEL